MHPFSGRPSNSLKITRLNRQALDHAGDGAKPIWLTELTWSSALGKTHNTHGWEVSPQGQGQRLTEAYRLYVKAAKGLKLQRIYWYTWVTKDRDSPNSFDWSGLREIEPDGSIVDKPAIARWARSSANTAHADDRTSVRPPRLSRAWRPTPRSSSAGLGSTTCATSR